MRSERNLHFLATAVFLAGLTHAVPAGAAPAWNSGLEQSGKPVSDERLGEMRGKFVRPDNIGFFGVQMMSSWQGPDGITTSATLLFSVDFANGAGNPEGAVPQLTLSWDRQCGGCSDPKMDVSGFSGDAVGSYVAIGGLNSVQGAVQSQQIAGSDNVVRNDMRIAFVPVSQLPKSSSGITPATAGSTQTFSDGDTLVFTAEDNELGLAMTDATAGLVRQLVSGNANQAAQHVLLSGDNSHISNGMSITFGLNDSGEASRVAAQNAMSSIRTIGF